MKEILFKNKIFDMADMKNKRLAPQTLQLEERAEIALGALINVADEDYGFIPFFCADFKSKPACLFHGNWDYGSSHGRLIDSITLAREMTGSDYGRDIEAHYKENLLSFFKEDGLNYRRNSFSQDIVDEHMSVFEDSASMIDQRAVLLGLTSWYLATGDEKVKGYADRHCAALKKIARKERDSWYYPASEFTQHGWPSFDAVHTRLAVDPCAMWGRQVMPLIRYYEATGNKDAYELSENFVANIMNRSGAFNKDGSFNSALEYRNGHFHTRMGTLGAIARFAQFTNSAYHMAWVKRSYDWALTQCTTFGWTPGDLHDQAYEHETCSLVDAIEVAIRLAKSGYSEYWGVAEKFIRNHLTESQLLDVDWIMEYDKKDMDDPGFKSFNKAATRMRGSFAGYAAPNDFVYDGKEGRGHIMDVQLCCVAAGIRSLHDAWDNAVTKERNRVWVNLLLNRSTEWVDVNAYMPHDGKVEVFVKEQIADLMVRIPEWVPYGAVDIAIEPAAGETLKTTGRHVSWVNKFFIKLTQVQPGTKVTVEFPLAQRTTEEYAVDKKYSVNWIGDDVIGISPKGTYYPLYTKRRILESIPMKEISYPAIKSTLL